jgi:ribonuclease VapC
MIVDTSALMAILLEEPGAERFSLALLDAGLARISAATALETAVVAIRRVGPDGESKVDRLFAQFRLEVVPLDREHVQLARAGFRNYGKGRHEAALNFGDCFSYALAKATGEPLLYKGNDFAQTDIVSALA